MANFLAGMAQMVIIDDKRIKTQAY